MFHLHRNLTLGIHDLTDARFVPHRKSTYVEEPLPTYKFPCTYLLRRQQGSSPTTCPLAGS